MLTLACLTEIESCSSNKFADCAVTICCEEEGAQRKQPVTQPGLPPPPVRHSELSDHPRQAAPPRQLAPYSSAVPNSPPPSPSQEDLAWLNVELRAQVAWLSGELVAFQTSTVLLFVALVCLAAWHRIGGERVRQLTAQALALGQSAPTDIVRRAVLVKGSLSASLPAWRARMFQRADETPQAVDPAEDDSAQASSTRLGNQTGGRLLQAGFEEDDGRWFLGHGSRQGPPGACSHSAMDDGV